MIHPLHPSLDPELNTFLLHFFSSDKCCSRYQNTLHWCCWQQNNIESFGHSQTRRVLLKPHVLPWVWPFSTSRQKFTSQMVQLTHPFLFHLHSVLSVAVAREEHFLPLCSTFLKAGKVYLRPGQSRESCMCLEL